MEFIGFCGFDKVLLKVFGLSRRSIVSLEGTWKPRKCDLDSKTQVPVTQLEKEGGDQEVSVSASGRQPLSFLWGRRTSSQSFFGVFK